MLLVVRAGYPDALSPRRLVVQTCYDQIKLEVFQSLHVLLFAAPVLFGNRI